METIELQNESRRTFLVGSGAFGLALTFSGCASVAPSAPPKNFSPNAWMILSSDGTVTLSSPASEMGQGTMTAMPLIIAEEMDLDWAKCKVVQARFSPKDYGNPRFGGGMTTGASRTVQGYWDAMRLAGAQARAVLIANAAARWNVPPAQVTTEPHACVHAASGRKLTYGEIAAFATAPTPLPTVDKSQLKKTANYRLIGKDVPRVDGLDKVTGRAKFGIDQRLPGMLFAAVMRSPVQGEMVASVDDAAARAIKGVRNVVRLPYGVAVVASDSWSAMRAKNALKITWSSTARARSYSTDVALLEFVNRAEDPLDAGVAMHSHGDTDETLNAAANRIDATYTSEHASHMCLEPMNATAWVREGKLEVWAPCQSASFVNGVSTSPLAGFKAEDVTVNITLLGGGYGRRVEADYVLDAVLVAKAMPGTPVQVLWSREDDVARDKLRPMTAQQVTTVLDDNGKLVAMKHKIVGEGIYARVLPPAFAAAGGKDVPTCEGFEINYDIPHHLAQYLREQRGVDVGFWRGVGGGYTKFAIESAIDETAHAAKQDPLAFRLNLHGKQPRAQAVLREVAAMARWDGGQARGNRALGLAYSDMWNSHCAMIVDVSVDGTTIKVHNVWAAVDCGIALQPQNVARQIEGSAVWGISAALKEKLDIKDGQFVQSNFHDYQVLRMNETPPMSVKVMVTDNHPGGIGEVGLPPVAPAIASGVASITGKRLRGLPFSL
jgi:isoquinoline 1-oxidoreductase subunit beta